MKKILIGMVVALAVLAMSVPVDARTGGYSQKLCYALESVTDYNTSTTATAIKGFTIKKNSFFDGQVIVMEAIGTIGVTSTPNLTIDVLCGATAMITSSTQAVTAGYIKIRAVGVVRSIDSVSAGTRTAGTILWSLEVIADQSADVVELFVDETADNLETDIPDQDVTFQFTWSASSSSNTLKVEQFEIWSW